MSDDSVWVPPKPFDREEVAALMAKAAELVAQLQAVLKPLEVVNSQPGRPDWWRQEAKNGGQGFIAAVDHAASISAIVENHQEQWAYWMVPGSEGFALLSDTWPAWKAEQAAKLAAGGKGNK